MLDTDNVLAQSFCRVRDSIKQPANNGLRLRITGPRVPQGRMYELPIGTERAGLSRITSLNPLFDSLHFPLLFPHGTDGYHNRLRYNPMYRDPKKRKYVTQREYYSFRLQYRRREGTTLIRSGKALQHFCIDAFTTIEQNRLTYLRLNQKKLRSDLYKGLNLGRTINPSSFTGGIRYMQQLYRDAMAVCGYYGNPYLFITFTYKPMIIARVFRMRLNMLKDDLKKKILLDKFISAELPDPTADPLGYNAVTKFMVHGPCGDARPSSPCMKDNKCSKFFPKPFAAETTFDDRGSVTYRRRKTNITSDRSGTGLGNAYVVPYNRDLIVKYQAHINVEVCHKGQLIKYLFKYITKGPDRSSVIAENTAPAEVPVDKISQYLDCRSISSYEAIWHLFAFPIHERTPAVFRLCIHLPHHQVIAFEEGQPVSSIVNKPDVSKTMLTEWFTLNRMYPSARTYTYPEIPQAFKWDKQCSQWVPRQRGFVLGRVACVPPRTGDVFYLRMLLTKLPGALSYEALRTVDGRLYEDFQKTCQALGLLSTDNEWSDVMAEVAHWGMPTLIRSTFVSLLVFCHIASPVELFEKWWPSMSDDFRRRLRIPDDLLLDSDLLALRTTVLLSLQSLLNTYSVTLAHFNLPLPTTHNLQPATDDLISEQLQFDTSIEYSQYMSSLATLNEAQKKAHDAILASFQNAGAKLFFLYDHGGTGKTYLYNCVISRVRSLGHIAIVVASSASPQLCCLAGLLHTRVSKYPSTLTMGLPAQSKRVHLLLALWRLPR
ncbi:hypothetical protein LINGRAHAP2_LOCUS27427 [Linum grandiflorum]